MWPNPQQTADLVIFTEEILNGKFHFCVVKDIPVHSEGTTYGMDDTTIAAGAWFCQHY